jgi:hypothetical protein
MYYNIIFIICIILIIILVLSNQTKVKSETFTNDPKNICTNLGYTYLDNSDPRNPQCVFTSDELISRCGINYKDPNGIFPKCSSSNDDREIVNTTIKNKPGIYNDCPRGYFYNEKLSNIHTKVCTANITRKHTDNCRSNQIFSSDLDITDYERTDADPDKKGFRSCDIQCDPKNEVISYDRFSGKAVCKKKRRNLRRLRDRTRLKLLGLDKIIRTAHHLDDLDINRENAIKIYTGKIIDNDGDIEIVTTQNKANILMVQSMLKTKDSNIDTNRNILLFVKELNNNAQHVIQLDIMAFNKKEFNVFKSLPNQNKPRTNEIIEKLNKHINLYDTIEEDLKKHLNNNDLVKTTFGDLPYAKTVTKKIRGKMTREQVRNSISKLMGRYKQRKCGKVCRKRLRRQARTFYINNLAECIDINRKCYETHKISDLEEDDLNNAKILLNRSVSFSIIKKYVDEFQYYETFDNILKDFASIVKQKYLSIQKSLISSNLQDCENIRNINGC